MSLLNGATELRRFPDWPLRLAAYIDHRRSWPFAWGVQDCFQFAANGVRALTGADLARGLRDYDSALGAARILQARAATGPADLLRQRGLEERSAAFAQRGDLVALDTDYHGETLGICLGATFAAPGESCLVFMPMVHALTSFRI